MKLGEVSKPCQNILAEIFHKFPFADSPNLTLTNFCCLRYIPTTNSVNYRLSPTFHSNAISLRAIILQTSGFHQSIADPFVTLETKFYVNDVITASVTCKKLAHVIYQLPATVIYYRPPVHFPISFIGQCLNFVP